MDMHCEMILGEYRDAIPDYEIMRGIVLDRLKGTIAENHVAVNAVVARVHAALTDFRPQPDDVLGDAQSRAEYDRGSGQKKGQLSQGSGTTPTIIDGGIVAITDNAESQMNVAFYERSSGREICTQPVFEDDESATESSLVSVGGGVIVENNHGYASPFTTLLGRASSPGFARVDVSGGACTLVWTSEQIAPSSVAKVSLANGMAYAYTKKPNWWGVSAWYLTALDVTTGRTVFSVRTGTGALMNNHYAAMTIAPDGAAWIATLAGLVRVRGRVRD